MSKHLTNLICSFQDMRDRYGDDDPVVADMKVAIANCELLGSQLPHGERRHTKPSERFWNYRLQRHIGSPAAVSDARLR